MSKPRIALVDLGHPSLTAPNKTLKVAEVLRSLKQSGQAKWAKYKGLCEVIVWSVLAAISLGYIYTNAHL
jgi:hypothetical protein